jgi:hypothetical protein
MANEERPLGAPDKTSKTPENKKNAKPAKNPKKQDVAKNAKPDQKVENDPNGGLTPAEQSALDAMSVAPPIDILPLGAGPGGEQNTQKKGHFLFKKSAPKTPIQKQPSSDWRAKFETPRTFQGKPSQSVQQPAGMSAQSKEVLDKLGGDKPFIVEATKYGTAIAESIIAQSAASDAFKTDFDGMLRKKIEFRAGSYALIYTQGRIPARLTPFVWQLDQNTRKTWAVFTFNNFYGHKDPNPIFFWKKLYIQLVLTPFDKSPDITDGYRGGYLAKFDEDTQFQMDIHIKDDDVDRKNRVDNKNFISGGLQLWQDLANFTKPQINRRFLLYIAAGVIIIIVVYWFLSTHPGIFNGLGSFIGGPQS